MLWCFGLVSLLAACTESLSTADKYAVKACGLRKLDDGGGSNSEGAWSAPDLTSVGYWTYNDSLPELEKIQNSWVTRAPEAAAAAQENAVFQPLAQAVSEMLVFINDVLSYRAQYRSSAEFFQTHTEDMYNGPLGRWKSDCAGLSARLNSK